MLTVVKNQIKVSFLSIKYALMREMLNKVTFLTNIIFMILNNASCIIQWIVLYSLKDNVGGYTFNQIMLLWGIAASTYGFSRFFFKNAFDLSELINIGKLDTYLVQPKNVLISVITSNISTSAIGDILFGYIVLFIFGLSLSNLILFTIFTICGGLILTSISIILNSLSFWFNKTDIIADTINNLMVNFATYPDGIFKGLTKILLYTLIPVGIVNYIPISIMTNFSIKNFIIVIVVTILLIVFAFILFYQGLKRYSSSNLMSARV